MQKILFGFLKAHYDKYSISQIYKKPLTENHFAGVLMCAKITLL